jgi:hypothetical protein
MAYFVPPFLMTFCTRVNSFKELLFNEAIVFLTGD